MNRILAKIISVLASDYLKLDQLKPPELTNMATDFKADNISLQPHILSIISDTIGIPLVFIKNAIAHIAIHYPWTQFKFKNIKITIEGFYAEIATKGKYNNSLARNRHMQGRQHIISIIQSLLYLDPSCSKANQKSSISDIEITIKDATIILHNFNSEKVPIKLSCSYARICTNPFYKFDMENPICHIEKLSACFMINDQEHCFASIPSVKVHLDKIGDMNIKLKITVDSPFFTITPQYLSLISAIADILTFHTQYIPHKKYRPKYFSALKVTSFTVAKRLLGIPEKVNQI